MAFPEDVYILDHNTEDGSTRPENLPPGVRVYELHGDKAGFPLSFMNRKAEETMIRLLRAGYPCVLFSDTDEFLVPDPTRYSQAHIYFDTKLNLTVLSFLPHIHH